MQGLSIVIPALNEAHGLAGVLQALAPLQASGTQVIVADGGSTDSTTALARAAGAWVVSSPQGRARQMNAGAAHAAAHTLLFLHADTQLPPNADQLIAKANDLNAEELNEYQSLIKSFAPPQGAAPKAR